MLYTDVSITVFDQAVFFLSSNEALKKSRKPSLKPFSFAGTSFSYYHIIPSLLSFLPLQVSNGN